MCQINPARRSGVYFDFFNVLLAILAFVIPHGYDLVRAWGFLILNVAVYGIVNDLRACRQCIEYFRLKYIYDGERLVLTRNDPNLNALIWGVCSSVLFPSFVSFVVYPLILTPVTPLTGLGLLVTNS